MNDAEPPVGMPRESSPRMLFHYTTATGLQGILESGRIWATELRFLNDERELQYGIDLLASELRRRVAEFDPRPTLPKVIDVLAKHRLLRHFFVACFCEEGDLLSQWRGYASPGGYALGIARDECTLPEWATPFSPVVYDRAQVRAIANDWASATAERFIQVFDDRLDAFMHAGQREGIAGLIEEFGHVQIDMMEAVAALVKSPSFAEEREWRIVAESHPQATDDRGLKFRPGPLGPTPYIEIPLRSAGGVLPLREVVVGPGSNSEIRGESVRMLLGKYGRHDVRVVKSRIPYRP